MRADMIIQLLGLDASGKTTMIYKLKLGEVSTVIPTIGWNVEIVESKHVTFVCWDVGGRSVVRPLWRHYYQGVTGIIFMVDSNDRERIDEVAAELAKVITNDHEELLRDAVLLVFANKQDLPNALSAAEVTDKLGLQSWRNRTWHVQPCCATSGDGLYEGLDWLSNTIKEKAKIPKTETSGNEKLANTNRQVGISQA